MPPGPAATAPARPSASLPTLPETEVVGEKTPAGGPPAPPEPNEGRSVLEGTIFSSPPANGYDAESATTGSLINVPAIDLPATVSVVPQAVLADQQVLSVDDLVRDVPGAVKVNDDRRPDALFLRGFLVTSRDYRKDGFLDPTYTPRDFADVQRVEVLQGPASVLYGAGQPSGSVNLITQNPLGERMQNATVQFGSFGLQRYTVDSTGPINQDGSLLYRVNAAYQNSDSFRDFGFDERTFVAPALTWVIDSDTTLTWKAEFENDRRMYDTGVAAVNGALVLPVSRFLGEPGHDFQDFHDYREWLVLNHRINDEWACRIGGYSLFYDSTSAATIPMAGDGLGDFFRTQQDIDPLCEQYQSVIANLAGKVERPLLTHNIVFGTELGWFTSNAFNATGTSVAAPINGFDPMYGAPPPPPTPNDVNFDFRSTFYQADYGLYFQDLVDIGQHWKLLAGVRYDHADVIFDRSYTVSSAYPPFGGAVFTPPSFPETRTAETFDEGTPRFGVIFEPVPERLSFYGMYSASFYPPDGGPYLTTAPLQPELGQSWEGGVKLKPLPGLLVTAAGFYINKENVTEYLTDPSTGFQTAVQVGKQRSQGVELSAVGKVTDRLSVVTNYTYSDTLQTDPANPALNGLPVLGVPYNSDSAWLRYNLIENNCRTFGVGLGAVYVGQRVGDVLQPPTYAAPVFTLPSYTRWDAGLYYKQGRWDASAYFQNIFNETYYTSSINQYEVFPGAPFNVRVQVGCRF